MPSIANKRPLLQRLTEDASETITDLIYEKVNQLLGSEDQLFTMEFPARPLNKNTYQYLADGTYSDLINNFVPKMDFLSVESPAETLEKNKQNMRACGRHSLDGSGTVYPAQFSPTNWFKDLEPNLHPKDLTMSVEALVAEYSSKKKTPKNSGEAADSNVMDVILTSESIQKRSEDRSLASPSHQKASKEDTSKIEIGFRVVKVSIDHGQWFLPNVFKMTQNFHHLSESICAPGLNKRPAFPTAYVIAKDMIIRVKVTESEMQENINYVESQNGSSGSLFGFSASSEGSSQSSSKSFYVESRNDFLYIRIMRPQILGWFHELVPQDVSEKYVALKDNPYEE